MWVTHERCSLPTPESARQVFRIDPWMQTTPMDEGFSQRLRDYLARQVDEAHGRATIVR
jgi:hypothetical protein